MTLQTENWGQFYPDAELLFPLHWQEMALFQKHIKQDLWRERYEALDAAGSLLIVTARDGARLIGYLIAFVMPHMHYKNAGLMAYTDMYYVLPDYRRGAGAMLFARYEVEARRLGCVEIITSCKVTQDHSQLFKRLGWLWTDKTFCKYIGGAKCP